VGCGEEGGGEERGPPLTSNSPPNLLQGCWGSSDSDLFFDCANLPLPLRKNRTTGGKRKRSSSKRSGERFLWRGGRDKDELRKAQSGSRRLADLPDSPRKSPALRGGTYSNCRTSSTSSRHRAKRLLKKEEESRRTLRGGKREVGRKHAGSFIVKLWRAVSSIMRLEKKKIEVAEKRLKEVILARVERSIFDLVRVGVRKKG